MCDYSCLIGCDNEFACNYSPEVLYNDGSWTSNRVKDA